MSNQKHLADLLKVCSILPALAIMPAMAEEYTVVSETEIAEIETISGSHSWLDASTTGSDNLSVWFIKGGDVTVLSEAVFANNKADSGIFSTSSKAPSSLTLNSGVVFENNTVRFDGGAVANYNTLNANGVTFRKNTAQTDFENDTTPMGGGALALGSESKTMIQNSIFSQNESKYHGGAIAMRGPDDGDNSAADLDIIDSEFRGNIAAQNGGAIYSTFYDSENVKDSVYIEDNEFVENKAVNGGAIYNEGLADRSDNVAAMKVVDSEFVGNIVTNFGGAVYNGSKLVLEDSDFSENNAYIGGAMFLASGSDTTIKNSEFDSNTADFGGAVYTSTGIKNVNVSDSKFTNNSAKGTGAFGLFNKGTLTNVLFENNKSTDATSSAGALFLGALAQAQLNNVDFVNNTSASVGGAIAMRGVDEGNNKDAKLDIIGGSFIGNTAATYGGAIFSTFYDSENVKDSVYIKGTEFTKNSAERGGAIYTEGKADLGGGLASMKIEGAKFTENMAAAEGGAIQNRSSMNIIDSTFEGNVANGYYGGALYNAKTGDIETLDADFEANKVDSEWFAIGGAFANIGKIGEVTGMFESNKVDASAEDASSKGGAIYTYAGSSIDSIVADFVGNQAFSGGEAIGGAVVNDGTITKLHQTGQGFVNNVSDGDVDGWAGALYNSETGVISELVANFTGNSVNGAAWAVGGALVNKGAIESLTGTFANNTVAVSAEDGFAAGGAVYNEGTINFDGDVLFRNNTAVEGADIYNDGIVNIVSGTTTIGTAVAGEGTLNVASDAILNIGTATVQQTQINIDGIVQASVLSDRSYGRLLGLIEAKDSAELKLNVGSVGSYKIFDSQADIDVTAGATYDVSQEADGTVVIATKAVEDIAAGAGISTQAAGAVAGLANADSGKAHQVSLALQEALNSGDAAFVEAETKKLNPTDKPVVQAAATSVQNQVLSLTSGRMAGGISVGRAGGDEMTQENGFWMQGLFNKSKFADAFHGYTRGIALGADTLIDKTWTIGGGLAFNNSDVHADGVHTDIDSKTLFLYGQYKPNKWYVNGTLTYNMSEYTENKTVGGVSGVGGSYDVDSYGAQVMTGYDFATGITTEAGLRYLYIDQDSYADGLDRQIMATDTDFLSGVAGVKYAFAIENDWAIQLRPELRAAMTYDFISDDTAATVVMPGAEAYAVKGERLSRMGGEFGIGLTALYKGMELSVMYDLDLHKDYTSQTGMIKFRTQF